jgi:hypothetical protein
VVITHRVVDPRARLEQPRQDFFDVADREGIVGAELGDRALRAGTRTIPRFPQRRGRPGIMTATASGSANPVR